MDLSEWLENGRVRALLDLVDKLPKTSHLWAARVNDPEEARMIAAQLADQEESAYSPPLEEFDLHAEQQAQIIDLLMVVARNTSGGKGAVKPSPRPVTEVHRQQKLLEREWADNIIAAFGFDA